MATKKRVTKNINQDILEKSVKRDMPFDITPDQRLLKLERSNDLETKWEAKKVELKEISTKFKESCKELIEQRTKIRKELQTNKEVRTVQVLERYDFKAGKVDVIHDGNTIATRKISDADRQTSIPGVKKPKDTVTKPLTAPVAQIARQHTTQAHA